MYIYARTDSATGNSYCENESSFEITITPTPAVDTLNDVDVCDSYTLPALNNGTYYSGTGGTGTQYSAGDIITSSQTMYIYARNDSATGSNYCEKREQF